MVVDLVHAALQRRGGAVRVDRAAYKAVHPHYGAFVAEDVGTAGVRVRPETYRWQADVEARVREDRYDAVGGGAAGAPERVPGRGGGVSAGGLPRRDRGPGRARGGQPARHPGPVPAPGRGGPGPLRLLG
ncbi:zeta toxin family protein [Streptomyces kronopolitis]